MSHEVVAGWWLSGLVGAESGVKGSEGSKMGILVPSVVLASYLAFLGWILYHVIFL